MATEVTSNVSIVQEKVGRSKKIIDEAFERYSHQDLAVAWSGGKDSTLLLWLVRVVCLERSVPAPRCFCIDEGDMFDEVRAFIKEWSKKWGLKVDILHNADVSEAAGGLGNAVKVKDLNERNQREVERLGYEEAEFDYEPESFVGNHLMKTVPLNIFLEKNRLKGFFEGIRWDEQGARANETHFSPRKGTEFNPEHMRIFPILHFTERDVWDA
ncbi:MAG: phosphoadenosine phosphosulfate reductase family protein, partial [Candidatus Bathyarchaeota archaeon]|nr:phosphoadenosine phosphosulfate reductase family protein [Candidatus Bathyarchaeota archaeon]